MKRRIGYSLAAVTATVAVFASSASAFTANPTDNATWRAFNSTAGPDRLGNSITNGDLMEMVWRWGNESATTTTPPNIPSSTYSTLSTSIKAMLDRVRDPVTGNISNNQLALFDAKEFNAESKVAAGAATDSQLAGTTSLFKARAALSLAPRLLTAGAIVYTVASTAGLVERAIVAGENKVFGWHIQLAGPYGIFGSWSPGGSLSANEGSVIVDGSRWTVVTTNSLCSAGTLGSCPTFDVTMNSATGGSVGSLDPICGCNKLFVLEPHRIVRDTLGNTVQNAYIQSFQNAAPCQAAFFNAYTSHVAGGCDEGSQRASVMVNETFNKASPTDTAIAHINNAGTCGCQNITEPAGTGWADGLAISNPGQWISTGNCTSGDIATACVAYTMTESQMEKFLGLRNGSGHVQSWAYEKPATTEVTNIQGGIDSLQPTSTYNPTVPAPTSVQTDTQRAGAQGEARDGTDNNAANWVECHLAGDGGSGQTCPSPWEDGYTVPGGCPGLTVSDCVALLQSDGFDGAHVDTTLSKDSAVLTYPAGAVTAIDPAGGATVAPSTTFNLDVNPTPLPIEIPARLNGNEVATDYAARLSTSGYTGVATYVTLDPTAADSSAGPNAVTFPITDTTTGTTVSPGDRIEPGDDITIYENPPTVPPVPVSGGGFSCSCPPIDFSPLSGIGLGSKFPFGIFTYAAGIIGEFNVSPHAPDFNLTAQANGIDGNNLNAPYDVNLGDTSANRIGGPLNTYMGYWRDLLSFCMWIGAIFFVGRKLLGYGGGGDPGEAVDEVL